MITLLCFTLFAHARPHVNDLVGYPGLLLCAGFGVTLTQSPYAGLQRYESIQQKQLEYGPELHGHGILVICGLLPASVLASRECPQFCEPQ
jgi:hypothetical protein